MTIHFTNTNNPIDFPKRSMIDLLWCVALDKAVPETYSTLSMEQIERVKAKFAELIIDEVCESFWNNDCHTSDLAYEDYQRNRKTIREHFGVE